MSPLEKLLFLADKVEPQKLERRPDWRPVRELARTNLDAALLLFLDLQIAAAIERGWRIHARTIAARNQLLPAESTDA
jgi:HD superfamily phosphohydrolase YqeK